MLNLQRMEILTTRKNWNYQFIYKFRSDIKFTKRYIILQTLYK